MSFVYQPTAEQPRLIHADDQILIVDKPAGVGSTDVVGRVRWALDAKKAGHAGTLDPDATGLLAVALGEATKTVPFLMDADKTYRFTIRWGETTAPAACCSTSIAGSRRWPPTAGRAN